MKTIESGQNDEIIKYDVTKYHESCGENIANDGNMWKLVKNGWKCMKNDEN